MLKTEERISSSILSSRLKKLEFEGVISSIAHPESGRRKLYYLTHMGKGLIHMMVELVGWASIHLSDHLNIPAEKKAMLETGPEAFKNIILEQLHEWEEKMLIV